MPHAMPLMIERGLDHGKVSFRRRGGEDVPPGGIMKNDGEKFLTNGSIGRDLALVKTSSAIFGTFGRKKRKNSDEETK